jgi:hypothetical protein
LQRLVLLLAQVPLLLLRPLKHRHCCLSWMQLLVLVLLQLHCLQTHAAAFAVAAVQAAARCAAWTVVAQAVAAAAVAAAVAVAVAVRLRWTMWRWQKQSLQRFAPYALLHCCSLCGYLLQHAQLWMLV